MREKTATFINGMMLMALICSVALNIQFYRGDLASPQGAFCEGFLSGAQNAIMGSAPQARK